MNNTTTLEMFRSTDLLAYSDDKFICFIDNNGKAGFKVNGKVVINPIYDYVEPFCEGIALVRVGDRFQYIRKNGEMIGVVDCQHSRERQFSEGIILLKSIVAPNNDEKATLSNIKEFKAHLEEMKRIVCKIRDRGDADFDIYGYCSDSIDKGISWAINDILERVEYLYVDLECKEICYQRFDSAEPFKEGFACVRNGGKWGYVNREGEITIPLIYDHVSSFNEGCASVRLNNVSGVINYDGEEVVPFKYDNVEEFHGGVASVKIGKEWGLVDKNGEEIAPPKYFEVETCDSGVIVVSEKEGTYGLMNAYGELVTPLKYRFIDLESDWIDGIAIAMTDEFNGEYFIKQYGFLGIYGKEITPIKYSYVEQFKESRALVKLDGRAGFVDRSGKEVVEPKYDNALSYSCGMAMVEQDGLCGYINLEGELLIPLQYECANSFSNNVALVKSCGKLHLINIYGETISIFAYDEVILDGSDILAVRHNDQYGLIDSEGKLILPIIYESAASGNKEKDLPSVLIAGKWHLVDPLGNIYGDKYASCEIVF